MVTTFLNGVQSLGQRLTGRTVIEAGDAVNQTFAPTPDVYLANEAYYDNTIYELWQEFSAYLGRRDRLYRHTTGVYNPFRRAVDWYPGAIYPGAMTDDGLPLPDGTPCCVPFDPKTEEPVRRAAMAMLTWANWETERYVYGRMLPKLGEAFGEIEIDYDRGKAYPRLHHPKYVTRMEWNGSGDVILFRLEIPQIDDKGNRYIWGKIVDKETVTTLKDGRPFSYDDQPATVPNPFGFVPAAWVQFRNDGGQHGQSLVDGVRGKVDRLNSSASSIHDYIAKFSAQGVILKTAASLKDRTIIALNPMLQPIGDDNATDEIRFLKAPADLQIDRLIQNLGLADALPPIQDLIKEIEADLPESTIDREMRANPPQSGPVARMVYGDVNKRHAEACGNADGGLRKLTQMGISINGYLMRSRRFGQPSQLSDTQRLFLPFDLDSYAKGDLHMPFLVRPLFPDTPLDKVAVAAAREKITTPAGLAEVGYSEDEIYGVGKAPKPEDRPGILEQRQTATTSAAGLFGNAFSAGQLGG